MEARRAHNPEANRSILLDASICARLCGLGEFPFLFFLEQIRDSDKLDTISWKLLDVCQGVKLKTGDSESLCSLKMKGVLVGVFLAIDVRRWQQPCFLPPKH